jgi:hypothetical protein
VLAFWEPPYKEGAQVLIISGSIFYSPQCAANDPYDGYQTSLQLATMCLKKITFEDGCQIYETVVFEGKPAILATIETGGDYKTYVFRNKDDSVAYRVVGRVKSTGSSIVIGWANESNLIEYSP